VHEWVVTSFLTHSLKLAGRQLSIPTKSTRIPLNIIKHIALYTITLSHVQDGGSNAPDPSNCGMVAEIVAHIKKYFVESLFSRLSC
jgi:hypothetical protein